MAKKDRNEKEKFNPDDEGIYEIDIPTGGDPYKEIVYKHLANIMQFASVEFRGGYWTNIVDKKGNEKEIYIPDTREIFCNAVYAWCLALQGKFDNTMQKDYKDFKEKKDKLEKWFITNSSIDDEVILGESYYTDERDKLYLETFKQKKLNLFWFLFAKINLFLKRKNFLNIAVEDF